MAAESSRSSSSADSYIGSLISLTSKSEIRYEGVLYSINTEESSIGLRNVRSFGTEGRKKDGPQVPPSDKVFEYILFRGSDIKDLQVKSSPSPPAQTTTSINSDPAIIQSHYPRPAATSSSLPSAVSGPVTDLSSHTAQLGHPGPGSTFQGGLPLYQPGGNLGSWGPSPPPSANGSGLAMPMYWQGYYGPPNGLPQLHQQSLLRPPPGLSIPPSMQQPMQYSGFHPSLPTGASNLSGSNLPEYPSPLISTTTNSLNLTSTPLPPSTLSTTLPHVPPVVFAPEALPNPLPNKAPNSAFPPATPNASLPLPSPLTTTSPDISAVVPPITNKPNAISAPTFPYQTPSPPMSSIVGPPSTSHSETLTPSLVTPGQLLQSGKGTISQPLQTAHKDVEVVQVSLASSSSSSEPLVSVSVEAQPPILPLPQPARAGQRMNGGPFQSHGSHHGYRGRERGRGTGSSRPLTKFTEDFDFMAMNEKFKKDEVWGHLGKSNKSNSKDKEVNGIGSDEDDFEDEDDAESSKFGAKQPVYNKDDFFDSLSSNALDRESNSGRTRFSEQMKIDTETFGEFSRYRGGRGGRGPGRGGRFRGSYYGRGYGYPGRGRGRALSGRGL